MKEKISKYLAERFSQVSEAEVKAVIEIPPEEKLGDYAIPCFAFAKKLHRSPALIAAECKEMLMEKRERLGVEAVGAGKTICMDYSSPNIAKNFHVGHLRTTVIGNSLYQIYDKLGYRVIRINHLGDWGTQFGKLIVAYKNWSSKEEVEEKGIEELLRIYVKFNSEMEEKPELIEEARSWFVRMEQNDPEAIEIWKWFKEISMVEFERVYQLLGISFDSCNGSRPMILKNVFMSPEWSSRCTLSKYLKPSSLWDMIGGKTWCIYPMDLSVWREQSFRPAAETLFMRRIF